MDRARVLFDFNILLKLGTNDIWPLSKTNHVTDSAGNTIPLSDGLDIFLYQYHFDVFNRRDYLIADGIVVCTPDVSSDIKWWCRISEHGIRHESDNSDFKLPELSIDEKRSTIYRKLDEAISLIGTLPDDLVRLTTEFNVRALQELDNYEQ